MREYTKYIILIFFILLKNYSCSYIFAQTKIDPEYSGRKTTQKDTNKVKILNKLSSEHIRNNPYKALEYAQQGLEIARKSDYRQGIAKSLSIIGIIYKNLGIYEKAINYSLQSAKIRRELLPATSFNDEWFEAKKGIVLSLNNLGIVYSYQRNYEKSLDYFLQSFKIVEELLERSENHDEIIWCKKTIAGILGNSGIIYKQQGKYEQALDHHLQCLKVMENLSIEQGIASSWDNIGSVYLNQGNIKKALNHFQQSLLIREATGDKKGITISLKNIGNIYITQGNYEVALEYIKRSLSIAEALGAKYHIMIGYEQLAAVYATQKKYKPAYQYHQMYAQVKDSLFNEEKAKEIGKLEARNEFEKKIAEEKARTKAEAKTEAERQKTSNFLQYSVIVIFIAVLLLVVFTLGRLFPSKKGGRPASHRRLGGMLPVRVSKFLIFIIFLLLFEFILVLTDPFVEKLSEGAPLIKVLFNVIVATIFFPIHRFFEVKIRSWLFQAPDNLEAGTKKPIKNVAHFLIFFCSFCIINSPLPTKFSIAQSDVINPKIAPPKAGQVNFRIDSLKTLLNSVREDTSKVIILNNLCREYMETDYNKALQYGNQGLAIGKKLNSPKAINAILINIGLIYKSQGDYEKALDHYFQALKISDKLGHQKGIASCYNNIGVVYKNQGDYPIALEYYFKSLKIKKELGSKKALSVSYYNIGQVNRLQGNYPEAMEYHFKSLRIKEELGDRKSIATSYNSIGIIYENQHNYSQALDYYFRALKIYERFEDKTIGIAYAFNNIGSIYYYKGDIEKSLEYDLKSLQISATLGNKKGMGMSCTNIGDTYIELASLKDSAGYYQLAMEFQQRALEIKEEIGDKWGMIYCLNGMGNIYIKQGRTNEAIEDFNQSIAIAKEIGSKLELSKSYKNLTEAYELVNNYQKAYKYHQLLLQISDTLFNEEKSKEIGKVEENYALEKKLAAQKNHQEELARIEAVKNARRDIMQYSGIFIFIVIFFVSLLTLGGILNLIPLWFINGLVFSAFLLFFEFMLVFLDPYIEVLTGGAPALKLAINTVLASMIYPLHQFFEAKLKKRILKKKDYMFY
ncbi:MAG: tetratricopeptide repeat protein [Cytophagales bacterium]|nr:tetratricopeptide repeat protein [Cytophagales bacterium]